MKDFTSIAEPSPFLALETATRVCSVAWVERSSGIWQIQEESEITGDLTHEKLLPRLLDRLIKPSGRDLSNLKFITVSQGPGSYTGLRVGISYAKGLATALNLKIAPISTLDTLAGVIGKRVASEKFPTSNLKVLPTLSARRGEVWGKEFYIQAQDKVIRSDTPVRLYKWEDLLKKLEEGFIIGGEGLETLWERNIGNKPLQISEQGLLITFSEEESNPKVYFLSSGGIIRNLFPTAGALGERVLILITEGALELMEPEMVQPDYGCDFEPAFKVKG